MSTYHDFESFLHNPWGFPTKIERAAIDCFKERNLYNINGELCKLMMIYFGDKKKLQKEGLVKQYNSIKTHIEENNLIGLILYGTNIEWSNTGGDVIINNYVTSNNNEIELTISSICQCLMKEYFNENNINALCINTPGFKNKYKIQ